VFLEVWQVKELRVDSSDVWQMKDLVASGPSASLGTSRWLVARKEKDRGRGVYPPRCMGKSLVTA
jgi:hypothetical protein